MLPVVLIKINVVVSAGPSWTAVAYAGVTGLSLTRSWSDGLTVAASSSSTNTRGATHTESHRENFRPSSVRLEPSCSADVLTVRTLHTWQVASARSDLLGNRQTETDGGM